MQICVNTCVSVSLIIALLLTLETFVCAYSLLIISVVSVRFIGEKKRENVFLHTVIFLILDVVEVLFYALLFTNYSCCCQNVLYVFVLPWNSFTSAYFGLPFWYICPVIIQYVL